MRLVYGLILALFAFPALAERQWLSAKDFEARVASRAAQVFDKDGTLFGTEYFLPKRQVIWQRNGEARCYKGTWSEQKDQICFRFESGLGNCFRYYPDGDKMVAVDFVAGVQTTTSRNMVVISQTPPLCSTQ
jgi:hypothetical protein